MRTRIITGLLITSAALFGVSATTNAALPHVVAPGETLWSISAANNLTTRTVAAYNGISEDAQLMAGQSIEVPTVAEGEAALATSPAPAASSSTLSAAAPTTSSPIYGLAPIWSPWGTLYLAPAAAQSWEAMRAESVRLYGQDLYPDGTLSAYRSYDEQAYLYDLFLSGAGAPANPPGTSSHETGLSVDVATPEMRWAIDQIGYAYGWANINAPGEWWHVDYMW